MQSPSWRKLPCVAPCHTLFSQHSLPSHLSLCQFPPLLNMVAEVTAAVVVVSMAVEVVVVFTEAAEGSRAVVIVEEASAVAATGEEASRAGHTPAVVTGEGVLAMAATAVPTAADADSVQDAVRTAECAAVPCDLPTDLGAPKAVAFATLLPDGTRSNAARMPATWLRVAAWPADSATQG